MTLQTLLTPHRLEELTGLRSTALREQIRRGLLPRPVKLNARVDRWPEAELAQVLQARAAGLGDEEVRALVGKLHQRREHVAAALRAEVAT